MTSESDELAERPLVHPRERGVRGALRRRRRALIWLLVLVGVAGLTVKVVSYVNEDPREAAIRGWMDDCGLGSRYDWSTLHPEGSRPGALGGTDYLYAVSLTGQPSQIRHFLADGEADPVPATADMDPVVMAKCMNYDLHVGDPNPAQS